ncbi:MAG: hypothetical protein IJC48_04075 [Clostridia bacterium]|nr:hypothetical protein [Clostridia bacterium]
MKPMKRILTLILISVLQFSFAFAEDAIDVWLAKYEKAAREIGAPALPAGEPLSAGGNQYVIEFTQSCTLGLVLTENGGSDFLFVEETGGQTDYVLVFAAALMASDSSVNSDIAIEGLRMMESDFSRTGQMAVSEVEGWMMIITVEQTGNQNAIVISGMKVSDGSAEPFDGEVPEGGFWDGLYDDDGEDDGSDDRKPDSRKKEDQKETEDKKIHKI